MSGDNTSRDTVAIERTFDAPVALVWQMWTADSPGAMGWTMAFDKLGAYLDATGR